MSRILRARPWQLLLGRLRPVLSGERRKLIVAAVALAAEVGLRALEPWPLTLIFDRLLPTAAPERSWLPEWPVPWLTAACASALVLIVGARAFSGYLQTITLAKAATTVLTSLRGALYKQLQLLPLSYHSTARAGDLTVRMTGDVAMLQDVVLTAALPLIADICMMIGMVALMLWLQPTLTLWVLLPVPLFLWRWRRTHKQIKEVSRAQRKREGALAASVSESFSAMKTVQALSLEGAMSESFSRQNGRSGEHGVRAKRLTAALERSVDLLLALSTGLLLWQGTSRVLQGLMSAGELWLFVSYLKAGFKPLQSFAKYTGRLGKATAAAERVVDVLERTPDIADAPDAIPAPALRGRIELRDVTFAYDGRRRVLDGLSLSIEPGQLVAIVGPSGVGKSSLANLLLRLADPTGGAIHFDGTDIRRFTLASLRNQVGVVLQETVLFQGTVRDNLTLGAGPIDDAQLDLALRLSNANDFVQQLPQGIDTPLGERGQMLSVGQRQRLGIARALLRATPILILDEPTTGLDEENDAAVSDALVRLAASRTTLLITHALPLAMRADHVVVLGDGRCVEQGDPATLLRAGGAFAAWVRGNAARQPDAPLPLPRSSARAS